MLSNRIDELKKSLVEYTSHIENMISLSIKGLLKKNGDVLDRILDMEDAANRYEMDIEDDCITIIAQFQPMAKDLRSILTILKMSNDLERMGDHAVNLSQHSSYIIEKEQIKPFVDLPRMADLTINMVKNSINSFLKENAALAEDVLKADNAVDDLRDSIVRELIACMIDDSRTVERALRLIEIARNLERIADLATNIAEDTIYVVRGKNVKHNVDK
ncbi:MAG: phosphate signaling complex protein PhoU [candidate division WOR-3 bacterium]|nr:phosphate signaling complex protein PhoU [candidate division WOR-3 bacterium]